MSMQDKIESGVLSMSYEQEELHKDLYLDLNVGYTPQDDAVETMIVDADYNIDTDDMPDLRGADD